MTAEQQTKLEHDLHSLSAYTSDIENSVQELHDIQAKNTTLIKRLITYVWVRDPELASDLRKEAIKNNFDFDLKFPDDMEVA